MKKNALVADEISTLSSKFYGIENSFDVQEFILFITEMEDLQITGSNLKARSYFHSEESSDLQNSFFYKNIVHPEDYNRFITHLQSCKELAAGQENEIQLRLKDKTGNWKSFLFRHRPYLCSDKSSVLGIAWEIPLEETPLQKNHRTDPLTVETLKRSRDKYLMLLNSLDQAFCSIEIIFDLNKKPIDYLFLETNPAFYKHIALIDPEGKTMRELVPDHEIYWFQIYGKVALTEEPLRFENLTRELGNAWLDLYAFPIGIKNSHKVGVLFSNISERKRTIEQLEKLNEQLEEKVQKRTQELQNNAELLQTIFDTTNEGIMVLKPEYQNEELVDFTYVNVNKIILEQYTITNLVGCSYNDINPLSKENGVFDKLKDTALTGKTKDFESYCIREGEKLWFRITTRRKIGVLIVFMEEITQRKLESQRLKENIRFKKHLTSASPDIIMIFNLYEEHIRYLNRDMAPIKGMRKKDILGLKLEEIVPFIHPSDRGKATEFHNRILKASDKDVIEIEFRLLSGKGVYQWYNALGKVFMRNKNAKVFEYMLLLRNVDKQIKTQKALINAEKLSIKGEIARTLAHELRNPLASIGMAAEILNKKIPKNQGIKADNYLNIITRSTKTLNKLVTDLLTSSNYSPAVLEKSCLAEILEESLKLANDRIYLNGIKVTKNYKGNYFIHADGEKLKIALLNLIINASEAMEPDLGILNLAIEKQDNNFQLIISDNGCGLEKEQLDKLFDAFYTQKADGIGVGLSSVKNILEEHDAQIKVYSEPEIGTTFHLSFNCHENF